MESITVTDKSNKNLHLHIATLGETIKQKDDKIKELHIDLDAKSRENKQLKKTIGWYTNRERYGECRYPTPPSTQYNTSLV